MRRFVRARSADSLNQLCSKMEDEGVDSTIFRERLVEQSIIPFPWNDHWREDIRDITHLGEDSVYSEFWKMLRKCEKCHSSIKKKREVAQFGGVRCGLCNKFRRWGCGYWEHGVFRHCDYCGEIFGCFECSSRDADVAHCPNEHENCCSAAFCKNCVVDAGTIVCGVCKKYFCQECDKSPLVCEIGNVMEGYGNPGYGNPSCSHCIKPFCLDCYHHDPAVVICDNCGFGILCDSCYRKHRYCSSCTDSMGEQGTAIASEDEVGSSNEIDELSD